MLPENLSWYFPDNTGEAVELIVQQGNILHAGGTRILRAQPENIKGLVDVHKLGLNYINYSDNAYYIGAACTFAYVIDHFRRSGKFPVLTEALFEAASTPLKNRITVGGSIKDFPIWSSLYAPLIALNAKVEIQGQQPGIFSIEDYVEKKIISTRHLVKQIIIDDLENFKGHSKRFSVIKFEYPVFTIAASYILSDNILSSCRLVVTGVLNRYQRFTEAEMYLNSKELTREVIEEACGKMNALFATDPRYSSEYKSRMVRVYFQDLLMQAAEEK